MRNPIRTTVIFGLISAILAVPLAYLPINFDELSLASRAYLFTNLIFYTGLLCHWSKTPLPAILFPSILLLGLVVWPPVQTGFLLVSLIVFSWIRSGICFKENSTRAILAEIITLIGGFCFVLFCLPNSILALPLAIWLFYLIQTLYFYIVPNITEDNIEQLPSDSFEQARAEMERLLDNHLNG